jgi:anthranilate synthase component 1
VLHPSGRLATPAGQLPASNDFLEAFDGWWSALCTVPEDEAVLPFTGGWFVYLGYELAAQIEPCLRLPATTGSFPVAFATRFASAVIRDHEARTITIVAEAGHAQQAGLIAADLAGPAVPRTRPVPSFAPVTVSEAPAEQYLQAVARIHEYIREGDVFQVNLSRRWQASCDEPVDASLLYRRLRRYNPAPFAGLARWGDVAVISSSPERLVQVRGNTVATRPIAGTRPRGRAAAADCAYSRELLAHPKERAEHIMLIDLERNDLGRICRPGTVQVDEFMVLESYAHVHHIVSNVRGELCPDHTPGRIIRAVFPGGTITGCPKVRCMQIIAELEQEARGAYTGAMGYINRDGGMDLNILIRSMFANGNRISVRTGAGIVADSVAQAELRETRAKAQGMLRALGAGES